MPVYLLTAHAYRSWSADHPEGYVQRGEGFKGPEPDLARWRAGRARFAEARFEGEAQTVIHEVAIFVAAERTVRLHGCATCPTHVHIVVSFRSPACTCGALGGEVEFCARDCVARGLAEEVIVRMKRKMGQRVAQLMGTKGRPWFSRGWDITPVRREEHFAYLMEEYLPEHESGQGGMFRKYS